MDPSQSGAARSLIEILFDGAAAGLCLAAPDGTISRANPEFLRWSGHALDDVLGTDIVELLAGTSAMTPAMLAAARAGHRVEVPRHAKTVDGRETRWEGTVQPVAMEGGTGLLVTMREARSDFRLFYETAPGAFLVLAPDRPRFTIVAATEAYMQATKTSRDIIGRGIFEVFPDDPDDPASSGRNARASFERVLDTGAPDAMAVQKHSIRRPEPEGGGFEERYWSPVNTPVIGERGEVLYIHHRVEDVTEFVRQKQRGAEQEAVADVLRTRADEMEADILRRGHELQEVNRQLRAANERLAELDVMKERRAAQALREKEERYHDLFDSMDEGFCIVEVLFDGGRAVDYRFLEVNPAFEKHTGLENAAGRLVRELVPGTDEHWFETYGRVALTGEPVRFESPARSLGRVYDVYAFRVGAPEQRRVAVLFSDVTARKRAEDALRESEERFRLLADAMPQLVWTALPDGTVDYYNCRFRELAGIEPLPDGRWRWAPVVHPDDLARTTEAWRQAVETGGQYEIEHRIRRADGTFHWFLSRGVPVRDERGRISKWYGTATDIHDQVQAQRALEEADRRKDEFLGVLSHELRNPLAPIHNSLYILDHAEPTGQQARRAKEVAGRQVAYLTRLVDDLLDVTRISRGKVELRRAALDLSDLVRRTGEDYRALMQERGLEFTIEAPREPVWIEGDETRLAQIVGNLLQNAAKFTQSGGRVTLAAASHDGAAEVRVRDTGAGIDRDLLEQVFEPFMQAKQSIARTEGGLGLGLALVKGLVELHGGTVAAASEGPGRGTEFTIRLPLARAAQRGAPRRTSGGVARVRRRVLVVDDSRDAAESLAELVQMFGHEAEVAFDGNSAVERARARPPDVVLCDVGLPGMTGYEVATALRADGNEARLFAITGYAQPEDVRRAIRAGFDGHVAKPVDPEDIARLLA